MTAQPIFETDRVYRTRDFTQWSQNPRRFARSMIQQGLLVKHGMDLFSGPKAPSIETLIRALVQDTPFIFSGPERWNELGLGTFETPPWSVVYNVRRNGLAEIAGRQFMFRKRPFPQPKPPAEFFVVDVIQYAEPEVSLRDMTKLAVAGVADGRFNPATLLLMFKTYGTLEQYEAIRIGLGGKSLRKPRVRKPIFPPRWEKSPF